MSIIVNTNVQSMVAQRNLTKATNGLNKSTERLSTGLKINRAADDAAGLYIATGLESQISGLQQCQTNVQLGVNVLSIAEGDLTTIQDNLMRIKDLATQAANGTYSANARTAIANEIDARVAEIDRIAGASNFNGINLLNNTLSGGLVLHVGAGNTTNDAITVSGTTFTSATFSKLLSAASSSWTWSSAGAVVDTAANANTFIGKCEKVLEKVTDRRTTIGVAQSRLEMASEGLATTIENVSAAKSTIMDTDVAAEVANYTKQQILQQISTSILTQANQAPSIALSLL